MENGATKTIREPARDIKICTETDVLVVGGGPAGVAAAVASARNGANTVLIERYGHLGGLATGGLVILIMPMSDENGIPCIAGICQEVIERLDKRGGSIHPKMEELGSDNPEIVKYWLSRGTRFFAQENRVTLNALFDPEIMKCVLNDMVEEANIKLFLHSWCTTCMVEHNNIQAVIFESKSGRQAIRAKIVIDTTGDGDMFASAGAAFDGTINPNLRSSKLALVFRVGNVDAEKLAKFKNSENFKFRELMSEIESLGGFSLFHNSWRKDVVWFNNFLPGLDGLNVEDLTSVEVNARKRMLVTVDFFKKNVPGFSDAYLIDTASQVGVRATRRLVGEYIVTEEDLQSGRLHEDTIAVVPARQWAPKIKAPLVCIPYRSLLPLEIENLLTAGRCFSADQVANSILAPIQVCMAQGQAAGTAAAISLNQNVTPRRLDIDLLQKRLISQGVPL